jgi:hypothetical protein
MVKYFSSVLLLGSILMSNGLVAQSLLDNDTLFVGSVAGDPGQQVILPLYMKNSVDYQGWQMPMKFGDGSSEIYCDSVSLVGTVMENWWFTAPFMNNNDWGGMQSAGAAGLVDLFGAVLPSGFHLAMNLFFTINAGAAAATIPIDTTRCSWYEGGPVNAYVVTHNDMSYITHVIAGSITINTVGIEENSDDLSSIGFDVYPSVIASGADIVLNSNAPPGSIKYIRIFDALGRVVDVIERISGKSFSYNTRKLRPGVYFIAPENCDQTMTRKIIIQ